MIGIEYTENNGERCNQKMVVEWTRQLRNANSYFYTTGICCVLSTVISYETDSNNDGMIVLDKLLKDPGADF